MLVASLLEDDEHTPQARRILERHFKNEYRTVTSITVPLEVACAIGRRAGETEGRAALMRLTEWEGLGLVKLVQLTRQRANRALQLGLRLRLKGMDAILVQVASEGKRPLITFDEEMAKRASPEVQVMTADDF